MAAETPCTVCAVPSESFCMCSWAHFCANDAARHRQEADNGPHRLFPVKAFPRREEPGYLDTVHARITAFEKGSAVLRANATSVEKCISDLEEAVARVQRRLVEIRDTRAGELRSLQTQLQRDTGESETEAWASICDDQSSVQKVYSAALRGAGELPQFTYNLQLAQVLASLDQLVTYRLPEPTKAEEEVAITPSAFIQIRTGSYIDHYDRLKLLGEGSYGKVYLAQHKSSDLQRAVKEVPRGSVVETKEQRDSLIQEVEILAQIDHPNVMKIFELYEDEYKFAIVSELITGGELFDYLCDQDTLSETFAATAMMQVLSAVCYLHKHNIVHRDLKPENILLESLPKSLSEFNLKLIDFGLSSVLPSSGRLTEVTGSINYMAPEVLNKKYDSKCDVWSIGVILFLMLVGYLPFEDESEDQLMVSILMNDPDYSSEQWAAVSPEGQEFVRRLMTTDPQQRPSAEEALNDPWIVKYAQVRVDTAQTSIAVGGLKKFRRGLKLKQAISEFMASQLMSKEETCQYRDVFSSLDINHDGFLACDELERAFSGCMSQAEAKTEVGNILKEIDVDHSGRIDYTEFIAASSALNSRMSRQMLERAFRVLDIDRNGKIDLGEMREILGKGIATQKLWAELVQMGDINQDGQIDVDEFLDIMQQTAK